MIEQTHPIAHLRALAGEIGCRMAGTPGNHAAEAYIAGTFRRLGYAVEVQSFPFPAWVEESTCLETTGAGPSGRLEAYANTFSPACAVTAALLPVGSLAELETADLAGKIVLLYGELAQAPLWTKAFFFTPDRDRRIIDLLETRRPAALLTVNPVPGLRWRLVEDADLPIPSATVSYQAGLELVRCAGRMVSLTIAARRSAGSTANVIARLPGQGSGRVVICAHYDTKVDTCGAVDNASGVSVLLTLAERLAANPDRPALELVAFTNEEYYSSPETDIYFRQAGASFGEIKLAVNVDGVGGALSSTSLAVFSASPALEGLVQETRQAYPAVIPVDPWPASNHYLFFSNGVPTLAFSSLGVMAIAHTPADTVEMVSPEKLEETVHLAEALVLAVKEKDPAWGRVQ